VLVPVLVLVLVRARVERLFTSRLGDAGADAGADPDW
jgi:hypothetical protein